MVTVSKNAHRVALRDSTSRLIGLFDFEMSGTPLIVLMLVIQSVHTFIDDDLIIMYLTAELITMRLS